MGLAGVCFSHCRIYRKNKLQYGYQKIPDVFLAVEYQRISGLKYYVNILSPANSTFYPTPVPTFNGQTEHMD